MILSFFSKIPAVWLGSFVNRFPGSVFSQNAETDLLFEFKDDV